MSEKRRRHLEKRERRRPARERARARARQEHNRAVRSNRHPNDVGALVATVFGAIQRSTYLRKRRWR